MPIIEIWTGTKLEKEILEAAKRVQRKEKKSKQDKTLLQNAHKISRRILLRRAGSTAALAALGGAGVFTYEALRRTQPETEKAYDSYLQSFEFISQGDKKATDILRFFKERRKRGKITAGKIIADEPGDIKNFYTVVIDPVRNRGEYINMKGAAEYRHAENPTILVLKDVPMTTIWKGVLLAHESYHIYQWLNGIEQSRPDGFLRGEQEAYDFEFDLLDKLTDGHFKAALRQQASLIEENKYRGRLSSNDLALFESLFPAPLSQDEVDLRIPTYLIALNFAAAEMRSKTPEETISKKMEYIDAVMSGQIPLLK